MRGEVRMKTWHGCGRCRTAADGLVRGHLAIWLDAVLEAVELPARIPYLDTGLAKVDGDNLTLRAIQCDRQKRAP